MIFQLECYFHLRILIWKVEFYQRGWQMSNCFESKCLRRILGIKIERIYSKCWDLSGISSTPDLQKIARERESNKNGWSQGRAAVGQLEECIRETSSKNPSVEPYWGQKKVQMYHYRGQAVICSGPNRIMKHCLCFSWELQARQGCIQTMHHL